MQKRTAYLQRALTVGRTCFEFIHSVRITGSRYFTAIPQLYIAKVNPLDLRIGHVHFNTGNSHNR